MRSKAALATLSALVIGSAGCGGVEAAGSQVRSANAARGRMTAPRPLTAEPVVARVREGDPAFGVSALVITSGIVFSSTSASAEAPYWLGALAEMRLRARGHDVRLAVFAGGYRLTAERATPRDVAAFLADFANVLTTPAAEAELASVIEGRAHDSAGSAALLTTPCGGDAVAVSPRVILSDVRGWGAAAHTRARVRVGVVGPAEIEPAARDVLARALPAPAASSAPAAALAGVLNAPALENVLVGKSGALPRVAFTVWDADVARAAAVADAWATPRSPLGVMLRARMAPRAVSLALGATGACITVDAEIGADELAFGIAESMGSMLASASGVNGALAEPASPDTAFALAAPTAAEAAERLAHVSAPTPATAEGRATRAAFRVTAPAEWLDGLEERVLASREALVRVDNARRAPPIEVLARVERGQGELHLLFGSPCLALDENETDAGHAALWMRAAALVAVRTDAHGVKLDAWENGTDVGLHAHGPALVGEDPLDHAERMARVLAEALVDAEMAEAQSDAARALAADESAAFELLATALAPQAPGRIAPVGTRRSLTRVPTSRTLFRRLAASAPRLAVIAPVSTEQATRAADVLAAYVPRAAGVATASSATACGARDPGSFAGPRRGRHLHVRSGAEAEAYVAVPLAGGVGARMQTEYLAAALAHNVPIEARREGASTVALGGASSPAVAVHLVAPNAAALEERVALAEKWLSAPLDAASARRAFDEARAQRAATPAGRLVALFRNEPAAPEHERAVRALTEGLGQGDVIVISRPR